jgi:tetratricopeptide (TPR) repeat protein
MDRAESNKNLVILTIFTCALTVAAAGYSQTTSDVDGAESSPVVGAAETPPQAMLPAHEEVRLGNIDLRAGQAERALEAYGRAEQLRPDAAEIAFGQGLGHFNLQELDEARDAFQRAAASENAKLATDALYSLAACDHAEALQNEGELPTAISHLEDAMKRYREVLKEAPDHAAAREANRKAASSWRRFKQQLQEQEQQQQSDSEKEDQEQNQEEKDKQDSEKNEDGEQQEQNQDQQSQDEQQKDQQESEQQQSESDEEKEAEQKQTEQQQKEQTTREQAKRRLREMMEAMSQRNKDRQEQVKLVQPRPVEKDW